MQRLWGPEKAWTFRHPHHVWGTARPGEWSPTFLDRLRPQQGKELGEVLAPAPGLARPPSVGGCSHLVPIPKSQPPGERHSCLSHFGPRRPTLPRTLQKWGSPVTVPHMAVTPSGGCAFCPRTFPPALPLYLGTTSTLICRGGGAPFPGPESTDSLHSGPQTQWVSDRC